MLTYQEIGRIGSLGNQLFEYATVLAIADSKGYEFGVPYSNQFWHKWVSFMMPQMFPGLSAKDSSGMPVTKRYHEKEDPRICSGISLDHEVFEVEDGTDFYGYFQSQNYFIKSRDKILKEFSLRPQYVEMAGNFLADLRAKVKMPIAFASFRVGDDYKRSPFHYIQPLSFYRKAREKLGEVHLVVVADDIDWCKANFIEENVTFCPYITDLSIHQEPANVVNISAQLEIMRQCDHGIVCSSSFSWWGAWLGTNEGRRIIAPLKWFKHIDNTERFEVHCCNWETC